MMTEKIDVAAALTIDSVRVGKVLEGSLIEFSDNFSRICRVIERLETSVHFLLLGIGVSIVIVSTSRAFSMLSRNNKNNGGNDASK